MTVLPKPASIADVARLAGVSVPTVSRVLTGAARVSQDKEDRVRAAIVELAYRPNGAARALVSGSQQMIVVLTSNTTYYGYAATIQGIEEAARGAGMMVIIAVIESDDVSHVNEAVDVALSQPIAGIVVLKFDRAGVAALEHLPVGTPTTVVSGGREQSRPQAIMNEADGGRLATEYLLSLGHRVVHHVSIPPSVIGEDQRTIGWRGALEAAGITPPEVIPAAWDARSGVEIGRQLARTDSVTAILCGNDEIAMGVIRGLLDAGKRVPLDISVVGFDDHPLSSLWTPPLTTVAQDFVELGRTAFGLLARAIAGDTSTTVVSEATRLIIRESTGEAVQRRSPRG